MAENDTPQHDRTEQPSTKRLDDARTRGEVPRSRELAMTAVVIAGAARAARRRRLLRRRARAVCSSSASTVPRAALFDANRLPRALLEGLVDGLRLLLPVAGATIVAAIAGSIALGGWSFSTEGVDAELRALESRSRASGASRA